MAKVRYFLDYLIESNYNVKYMKNLDYNKLLIMSSHEDFLKESYIYL